MVLTPNHDGGLAPVWRWIGAGLAPKMLRLVEAPLRSVEAGRGTATFSRGTATLSRVRPFFKMLGAQPSTCRAR